MRHPRIRRPRSAVRLAAVLLVIATAARAQHSGWQPFIGAGMADAGMSMHGPPVSVLGQSYPSTYSYELAGAALDVGIGRRLSAKRSARIVATWLRGSSELDSFCLNEFCAVSSQAFMLSTRLAVHRANPHAWGPRAEVGFAAFHVRAHSRRAFNQSRQTAVGPTTQVSLVLPGILHIAPVIILEGYLARSNERHSLAGGRIGLSLQAR